MTKDFLMGFGAGKAQGGGGGSSTTVEALSVTENGTYTAPSGTAYSPVTVNVSGGGGGSYELVASGEVTAKTTSTAATTVGTLTLPETARNPTKILYVKIRDKDGPGLDNSFWGADAFVVYEQRQASTNQSNIFGWHYISYSTGAYAATGAASSSQWCGVYVSAVRLANDPPDLLINAKYNAANYSGTIDGTYVVEVYLLDWPDGVSPFAT